MKPQVTNTKILGLPLVINEAMEPGTVFCVGGNHEDSQTGRLELHCGRDAYEKVLATPELRALVAGTVAKIKQGIALERRGGR